MKSIRRKKFLVEKHTQAMNVVAFNGQKLTIYKW